MKIRAYTLDSSKLLKRGAPEYDPHQEQAKTDVTLDGHIGQECYVEIMDEALLHVQHCKRGLDKAHLREPPHF